MFGSIVTELVGGFILAAILALAAYLGAWMPSRRLWRLRDPVGRGGLRIYVATRDPELASYALPLTGFGQLQAVGALAPSLTRAYRGLGSRLLPIQPASDTPAHNLADNLIVIGGASRNVISRRLLSRLEARLGIRQGHGDAGVTGDRFFVRQWDQTWMPLGGRPRDGTVRPITKDYGLIVRAGNPWGNEHDATCLLFAGVHTYGTAAAAQYFVRRRSSWRWWGKREVLVLLEVEVEEEHVLSVRRIKDVRRLEG